MCNTAEIGIGDSIVKLMCEVNRLDKIIAADTKEIAALNQTIMEKNQQIGILAIRTSELIDRVIKENLLEG